MQQIEEQLRLLRRRNCGARWRSSPRPASEAETAKTRIDRGQPAAGGEHRQALHQSRPAVSGPDPGRQYRPDAGGGQVRVPPRIQILDLCHLVGAAGHHARDRGPGAHHPHSGAHDRDDQQADPHVAAVDSGIGARADQRGTGQAPGFAGFESAQGDAHGAGADIAGDPGGRRGRVASGRFPGGPGGLSPSER